MTDTPNPGDYCPPPTERLCECRQCRAEWEAREAEVREAQLAAWRKAISKASKLARTQRTRRKPPPAKVGMHRKPSP